MLKFLQKMNDFLLCTPRLKQTLPFFPSSTIKEEEERKAKTARFRRSCRIIRHYELPVNREVRVSKVKVREPLQQKSMEQRIRPFRTPYIENPPISPKNATLLYYPNLTEFEKKEINDFPDIYFLGKKSEKIIPTNEISKNYGFDDDSCVYKANVGDHLAYRYEILDFFGEGAFGTLIKCFDHKTKSIVAVKCIVNTDVLTKQSVVESRILSALSETQCRQIVRAFDYFIFRSHPFITFEVLGENLSNLCDVPMQMKTVRNYSHQILTALEAIHRKNVIHCDIKPDNVMLEVDSKSLLKIIDFGSSCFNGEQMYSYIQSRHYRAPEVILGLPYSFPIDMWGFGCVLAEMINGAPLFQGEDECDQLQIITSAIGYPPLKMINEGTRSCYFYEKSGEAKTKYKRKPFSMPLSKIINTNDKQAIDLITRCLKWEPEKRITSYEALNHPFIKNKSFAAKIKSTKLPYL